MNLSNFITPLAIIVAGMIVGSFTASAIIYVGKSGGSFAATTGLTAQNPALLENVNDDLVETRDTEHITITENDRFLGSINAPVKLIDYSDTECPFCKRHHQMIGELFAKYDDNDFAWVYRHLPLDFHVQAMPEAIATECVAKLGGEEAFWKFLGKIYETTTSNDGLDLALLPEFAREAGVSNINAFNSCYENEETRPKVEADIADANRAGGSGTPYSRLVSENQIDNETRNKISNYLVQNKMQDYAHFSEDGFAIGISGALPEATFATIIDELLAIN